MPEEAHRYKKDENVPSEFSALYQGDRLERLSSSFTSITQIFYHYRLEWSRPALGVPPKQNYDCFNSHLVMGHQFLLSLITICLLSFLRLTFAWKLIIIALIVTDIKTFPLVWHVSFFPLFDVP